MARGAAGGGHGELMDSVYRTQRHIYDLSRKYYLLGRDGLIADLAPPPGGAVLEIGCGTGRNLVAVGRAWPDAFLYGVDISEAMLETARGAVAKAGLAHRVALAQGDACDFDASALFGRAAFDRVFISYALSMIPEWRGALAQAARCVAPGGRLEFVDFGQQDGLPSLWRRALFGWLARFHVAPRAELGRVIAALAKETGTAGYCRSLYRGYAIRGGLARG
ncbi:class I SAM-dependent methyltransferase [Sphingopyxis indica]|uniref:class I SAM-dependent methyltransferase n=1 Tax=Sphingopyxis indica TaxID=436663 RepID=UPI0029393608|nr:class I SAM-dependent methyltransferase [Sphingopyxis indica]